MTDAPVMISVTAEKNEFFAQITHCYEKKGKCRGCRYDDQQLYRYIVTPVKSTLQLERLFFNF
jgi:hypothetical protein